MESPLAGNELAVRRALAELAEMRRQLTMEVPPEDRAGLLEDLEQLQRQAFRLLRTATLSIMSH